MQKREEAALASLRGLLDFLLQGIEYAKRPQHPLVHRYVYRRNLAHTVTHKACGLLPLAAKADGGLGLLLRLQLLVHGQLDHALWCKCLLPPLDLLPADASLDAQACGTLKRYDDGLAQIYRQQ